MRILFVTNYMTQHYHVLCDELDRSCDNFVLLATEPISDDRLALGYDDMNHSRDYIVRDYDGSTSCAKINQLIVDSDVVMFGNCKNEYVDLRFKESPEKLTFFTIERLLKHGLWTRFIPIIWYKWYRRIIVHKNQNAKVLCASAYTPYDLTLFGFPSDDRYYKWGYFPEISKASISYLRTQKAQNKVPEIIFCGRLISWKKLDVALRALAEIKQDGNKFHLTVVGDGNKRQVYERLSEKLHLGKSVTFVGSVPYRDVQLYMSKANIAVFTSSFGEGWGAVLNEYMANSCAVVSSHASGSVPYLLRNNENAIIYRYGDNVALKSALTELIINPKLVRDIGQRGYQDYFENWTPKIAAERLIGMISHKKKYDDGPCSEAKVIKNNWFK